MTSEIRNIVIVGGGTAGWLTAGVLGSHFNLAADYSVRLIESPNIKTIGVGEGTWPSMAATLRRIGIPESQFIAECDASFKQGSKFIGWQKGGEDHYYHPFSLPTGYSDLNLPDHWLANDSAQAFDIFATPQVNVCNEHLAPKQANTPDYASVLNYGYHLDAGKFADLLMRHSVNQLGVEHIRDDVLDVVLDERGDIAHLKTENNGDLKADLFIDCTGFKSLLIGQTLGVPFRSVKDILFNDHALALQLPHAEEDSPIASSTHATAHSIGWIWDIALPTRRGVGLVYSSEYGDHETALSNFRTYLKKAMPHIDTEAIDPRVIPLNPGHRERFWQGNCVSIGLSGGFIDPLEATAMVLIELGARFLTEHLPASKQQLPLLARQFNQRFSYHWSNIIDFIKLHYVLSERDDSDYWRAHRDPVTSPERLVQQLEAWRERAPWHADVDLAEQMFPPASYQYVLYGMGFQSKSGLMHRRTAEQERQHLMQLQQQRIQQQQQLMQHLPTNRALLNTLRERWQKQAA